MKEVEVVNGKINLKKFVRKGKNIVVKMGRKTEVFRDNSVTTYFGRKQHTEYPFVIINGETYKIKEVFE